MPKNKSKSKQMPLFESVKEMVDFFDTHDMGEYLDQMPEVTFEIDIKRKRHLFAIDEELVNKLNEIAKSKKISPEILINSWIKEKITNVG